MDYMIKHTDTRKYLHYYKYDVAILTNDYKDAMVFESEYDAGRALSLFGRTDLEIVGNIDYEKVIKKRT